LHLELHKPQKYYCTLDPNTLNFGIPAGQEQISLIFDMILIHTQQVWDSSWLGPDLINFQFEINWKMIAPAGQAQISLMFN